MSIVPFSPSMEEPKRYFCDEYRSITQKFIAYAKRSLPKYTEDIVLLASVALTITPLAVYCATFTASQLVLPLGISLAVGLFLEKFITNYELPSDLSNIKKIALSVYKCYLFAVPIFLMTSAMVVGRGMFDMNQKSILPLAVGLHWWLMSLASDKLSIAFTFFANTSSILDKVDRLKEKLRNAEASQPKENAMELFKDFGNLSEINLQGLEDVLPMVLLDLDAKEIAVFSLTSKTINCMVTQHPYWKQHTFQQRNDLLKKFLESDLSKFPRSTSDYFFGQAMARMQFNLATFMRSGIGAKTQLKTLAAKYPQRFARAIELLSEKDYSPVTDLENGKTKTVKYWSEDLLKLCLYKVYLSKDPVKASDIIGSFSDPHVKHLALKAKIKHYLIRHKDIEDIVLEAKIILGENSENFKKIHDFVSGFQKMLGLFNKDPKKFQESHVKLNCKYPQGVDQNYIKIYNVLLGYLAFKPSSISFSASQVFQRLNKIVKIQALGNIPDALEMLTLVRDDNDFKKAVLKLAYHLPDRQRDIIIDSQLKPFTPFDYDLLAMYY